MKVSGPHRLAALGFGAAALLLVALAAPALHAEDDECCQYPGFRGGPFPGTPSCTEGFKTEPLTCTNCTTSWDPAVAERIVCKDDDDCVRLVGKYMACSAPIGPFLVDDEDNVYFWSGRWHLHALDKQGNLRWRFDLCNPPEDSLCAPTFPYCQPEAARMVPMVMGYHGTLYFFIGNVMYAISSDGELLLKHRIEIPGFEVPTDWTFQIGTGEAEVGGNMWLNDTGSPVLHTDGTISAAFSVGGWEARGAPVKPSGVLRLSRTGEILSETQFLWRSNPHIGMFNTRLLGTTTGHVAYVGYHLQYPEANFQDYFTEFYLLDGVESVWKEPVPVDYNMPATSPMEAFDPEMAVGPQGRIYGMTQHGAVYAFDPDLKTKKRIFHFRDLDMYTWQNRPVVAGDGTMYFAGNEILQGGSLWALDTQELWRNPDQAPHFERLPVPKDHPGIKWARVYGGGGGWTTPVLSKNGRVYVGMSGIAAHDAQSGEQIWWFGKGTMASAPTILSDGTIVVGQGITGRIFFLKEDTPNGGMAEQAWPTVRHDRYLSNNANHPFRWDRSGEPPYEPLSALLEQAPPCWNEADWNEEECGPVPDPAHPPEPPEEPEPDSSCEQPDAGPDTGDARPDVGPDVSATPDASDASASTPPDATTGADAAKPKRQGCTGCTAAASSESLTPLLTLGLLLGLGWYWRRRRAS